MANIQVVGVCCADCVSPITYDDFTALDDQSEARVKRGMSGRVLFVGELVDEFSAAACDCCGTRLAGERHELSEHVTRLELYSLVKKETDAPRNYSRTGYGSKIPTSTLVEYLGRWRRVYCRIYSNIGTSYIIVRGEKITIN